MGACAIFKFAPIEDPEAPFGEKFGKKMRKITIVIFLITMSMSGVFSVIGWNMAIPMLVSSYGALNKTLGITNTLKTLFGGITAANTAATEA